MEFPEPTHREARVLILGLGAFWGCFAITCACGIVAPRVSAVPLCLAFTSIFWFFLRGVYHVAARAENVSVTRFLFWPVSTVGGRSAAGGRLGWMSIMSPTYLRRSAEFLGWNVRVTFRIIFAFAALAIALFVVLLLSAAAS